MADSFCGRNCDTCEKREELDCPGCRRLFICGDSDSKCEIGECCTSKERENCTTCEKKDLCYLLKKYETKPEDRANLQSRKRAEEEKKRLCAGTCAGPLKIIFWFSIIILVPNLFVGDINEIYGLKILGNLFTTICEIVIAVNLFRMSKIYSGFISVGVLMLVNRAIDLFELIAFGAEGAPDWFVAISLPASICALIAEYKLYSELSDLMLKYDSQLADKWLSLRKIFVVFASLVIASALLIFISKPLGLIVLIVSVIALIVNSIRKIVYLRQSSNVLTYYSYD